MTSAASGPQRPATPPPRVRLMPLPEPSDTGSASSEAPRDARVGQEAQLLQGGQEAGAHLPRELPPRQQHRHRASGSVVVRPHPHHHRSRPESASTHSDSARHSFIFSPSTSTPSERDAAAAGVMLSFTLPAAAQPAVPPREGHDSTLTGSSFKAARPLSSAPSSSFSSTSSFSSLPLSCIVDLPQADARFARSPSIDSPILYDLASSARDRPPPTRSTTTSSLEAADAGDSKPHRTPPGTRSDDIAPGELSEALSEYDDLASDPSDFVLPNAFGDDTPSDDVDDRSDDAESLYADSIDIHPTTALAPAPAIAPASPSPSPSPSPSAPAPAPTVKHTPAPLNLDRIAISIVKHDDNDDDAPSRTQSQSSLPPLKRTISPLQLNKPLPRSPSLASPFASLFGWGSQSPSLTDPSSITSPLWPPKNVSPNDALLPIKSLSDTYFTPGTAAANPITYCESYLSTPPPSHALSSIQVEEMEDELKAISSELAASIRREMDLEELVDRLQEQANNPQAPGKRTSDYFSDSGLSSAKLSEYEHSREEIEKVQRRAEQEKASIRLELSTKLQDERSKRTALDLQIKELSEKASRMDLAHMNGTDAGDRVRNLEASCEDLRRKLSQERESKANIEDLLAALKCDLEEISNERDNLRDEVVPQLRARVEGLESEATGYATLTYESTKMQQELQSLQQENSTLRHSHAGASPNGPPLSRSSSTTAKGSLLPRAGPPPALKDLSRSNSVKNGTSESREQLAERLKDVEAQRDALHNALKNLLERQEVQNRESRKQIKSLQDERLRLLTQSPRRAGFESDIKKLRTEMNVLRRRAEEAIEQKWQVEKGLAGLKMDLDRAEEEIKALRSLLTEKDILIPSSIGRPSSTASASAVVSVTSESLARAYKELQETYMASLERLKQAGAAAEGGSGLVATDEKTLLALQRLEQSLSAVVLERDTVKQEATLLRGQVDSLTSAESQSVQRESGLAGSLEESAKRVEQLAAQVRQQLASNAELRDRLAKTVARGDADRKANTDQISGLQERLHKLEELLVAAQGASEERVARHEDEVSRLREAHSEQLRRLEAKHAPVLKRAMEEEAQMKALRAQVTELEKALADADGEIQEIVAKMSMAQIEVMNLQEERESAVRETKRLQAVIEKEQAKAFEERFKTTDAVVVQS
ncbi:intracellular protein transport-like protein [Drechmeria coniospora]|uniref:Intracellular protein transport-like protein n=1 Tax=Drechmeria coniospora TaxID=98403 RepID=A0A151GNJ8_DRECN|nr:intracellular protein transport-like protein [Drechmeria coniospora]KYK58611.1 intracellular protein transport-like protein [Drechmeria coniospora]